MQNIIKLIAIFLVSGIWFSCNIKKQIMEKYCTQDTVQTTITVHDTVTVERIITDTVFSETIDSVVVTKEKLVIKYQKKAGKVYLSGEYKGDTIYREKIVEVKMPCNCPQCPEPTLHWWDYLIYALAIIGFILLLVLIKK